MEIWRALQIEHVIVVGVLLMLLNDDGAVGDGLVNLGAVRQKDLDCTVRVLDVQILDESVGTSPYSKKSRPYRLQLYQPLDPHVPVVYSRSTRYAPKTLTECKFVVKVQLKFSLQSCRVVVQVELVEAEDLEAELIPRLFPGNDGAVRVGQHRCLRLVCVFPGVLA